MHLCPCLPGCPRSCSGSAMSAPCLSVRTARSRLSRDTTKISKQAMWCRCTERNISPTSSGCSVRRLTAQFPQQSLHLRKVVYREAKTGGKKVLECKAKSWQVAKEKGYAIGKKLLLRKCRIEYNLLCNHGVPVYFYLVCVSLEFFKTSLDVSWHFDTDLWLCTSSFAILMTNPKNKNGNISLKMWRLYITGTQIY